MLKNSLLAVFSLFISITFVNAQTLNLLAQLNGSPLMNTSGWNLTGSAAIGDTPGDADNLPNELILVPAQNNLSGGIFFNQPVNLGLCDRFVVEFEFRMFNGSAQPADGLAFCFLGNPPTGFVTGGGLGIPQFFQGLIIGFDTWENCTGNNNPEVQVRYGNGTTNYNECPNPPEPTVYNQNYLRSTNYQQARIEYSNGLIVIFINNNFIMTASQVVNYTGYFGFTASTGGSTDIHSIRNVNVYTSLPEIYVGVDTTICSGDSISLGSTQLPGYNFTWTPATHLSNPNSRNPVFNYVNTSAVPQSFTYIVTADTTGISCSAKDTIVVTVLPEPNIGPIVGDSTLCAGETLNLSTNNIANALYNWIGPNSFSNSTNSINIPNAQNLNAGIYQVWASLQGCEGDTLSINVSIIDQHPAPNLTSNSPFCVGEDLQLETDTLTGASFSWSGPGGFTSTAQNPTRNNSTLAFNGTYFLSYSLNGCFSDTSSLDVEIYPTPEPKFPDRIEFCPDSGSVAISPGIFDGYLWSDFSTDDSLLVTFADFYSVTVTDSNGCVADAEVEVIENCPFTIWFPNAFSPNNNGLNDVYKVIGTNIKFFEMSIFNRWGEQIFLSKNINFGWDGTFNGEPVPAGMYIVRIKYWPTADETTPRFRLKEGLINVIR